MAASGYAGEHRGHRLVARPSPRGDKTYRLPERLVDRPVSEIIRGLAGEGWSRAEISRVTGILYQHVRNVLEGSGSEARPAVAEVRDGAPGRAEAATIDRDEVGSLVAFADLVRRVEGGERITVLRDGAPVARIVPFGPERDRAALEAALARMDERRRRLSVRGLSVKELINEGRP